MTRKPGLLTTLYIAVLLAAPLTSTAQDRAPGSPAGSEAAIAAMIAEFGLREGATPVRDLPGWQKPTRIVVRTASPQQLVALRQVAPGVELLPARDDAEALAAIPGAQGLVGFCSPELVAAGEALRWIQIYSAGAGSCVAVPGVRERQLIVTNMQKLSSPEISEHVLAMLLAFTRGLNLYIPEQRRGTWNQGLLSRERAWELKDRTMLVVGLGGIGSEVARKANGLGMRVVATRASAAERPAYVAYVGRPEELLQLAAEADVVVNTAPLLPSTERLFNGEFFAAMKPGGYFINISRGQNVDQDALLAALRDGRLAGAGLDVTDPEPLPPEHPLWQQPNVIITPHIANTSDRFFQRVSLLAQENLRRYVAGERLLSVVDLEQGY